MHVRASGPFSRLGWMLLGAGVFAVVGAFLFTLVFTNTASALVNTVFYLLLVLPCAAACAVVAWTGYLFGSALAERRGARESTGLLWSALAAVATGVIAIVVALVGLGDFFAGFVAFSVSAALIGAVLAVTLARLPLDAAPRRRD